MVIAGLTCHSPGVWSALVRSALLAGVLCEPAAVAASDEPLASDAQPGLHKVGVATTNHPAVAATLGYGYTEPQQESDGAHHRLSLRAALALPVLPWLGVGPIVDFRYDLHPHDTGAVLEGALLARATATLGAFRLGGELKGWAPGAESAGMMLDATSLDARALVSTTAGDVRLAGAFGYRLDRTAAAGADADRLGPGDRLALGLSDFDAVLLGLGAGVPLGRTEILAEVSTDLLVGRGAPPFGQSPFRVAGGVRSELSPALGLELLAVASLSEKPNLGPGAPLVPNEPRLSVLAGVRYQFLPRAAAVPVTPAVVAGAPARGKPIPPPPAPTDALLDVSVKDEQGAPVAAATAFVTIGPDRSNLSRDDLGHYRHEHLRPGTGTLRVEAPGFEPLERPLAISAGTPVKLELTLTALPPPSQVRGLVRSFDGKPLDARVHVEPVGLDAKTDATGAFQLDLPPGSYDVELEADGYVKQRRHVQLDPQGVVILNADLMKKKK